MVSYRQIEWIHIRLEACITSRVLLPLVPRWGSLDAGWQLMFRRCWECGSDHWETWECGKVCSRLSRRDLDTKPCEHDQKVRWKQGNQWHRTGALFQLVDGWYSSKTTRNDYIAVVFVFFFASHVICYPFLVDHFWWEVPGAGTKAIPSWWAWTFATKSMTCTPIQSGAVA